MNKKNNKQKGGDGYVVNVNQAIGGLPAFSRYSNNYRPIFEGELLQNGGDGYSVDISQEDIGGIPVFTRYNGENDKPIFDLVQQFGGNKNNISQFYAIRELSHMLSPLSTNSLMKLNTKIFLNHLSETKPKKSKQLGGFMMEIQNVLAPLGKNNLLVLAALLLLHHFAVDQNKNGKKKGKDILKGGSSSSINLEISNILKPLGINQYGSSIISYTIQDSFLNHKNKKSNIQNGGSVLKNIIAPLGTNAFIATGLLIVMEKLFTSKMNESKSKDKDKKKLIGGRIDKNFDKLFNLVAPITFNTFAKESFLKKQSINKK